MSAPHRSTGSSPAKAGTLATALVALGAALTFGACEGDRGPAGPPGDDPPTSTDVPPGEPAPELRVEVLSLGGASGPGGNFVSGDHVVATFRLTQADGTLWRLEELSAADALLSGPTFGYARVLGSTDVRALARAGADGSYTARLGPLPATYLPPLNDSDAFGADDGERTGQPLLDGTYTLGLSFTWDYTVEGAPFVQVGEATAELLVGGGARGETSRAVVGQANCERCHVRLQAHGGRYLDVVVCLLCHTAGAEDANDPDVLEGTPGVSVESRVLFHRLHNGAHLPSLLGIAVDADGKRTYGEASEPLVYARSDGTVADFSQVSSTAFPAREQPRPRDLGFGSLGFTEQLLEDQNRRALADCAVCHGDPDGEGPVTSPAQGDLIFSQPSRRACGSCHDDVDWTLPYDANGRFMEPQPDDTGCFECHVDTADELEVERAHRHPLADPAFTGGLRAAILDAVEGAQADGDGRLEVGESLHVDVELVDEGGSPVASDALDALRFQVAGPTQNPQVVLSVDAPPALLDVPGGFDLPELVSLELVGASTGALDTFVTALAPHYDPLGAPTRVFTRGPDPGPATSLAAPVEAGQVFLDVLDASGFARDDRIVVDDGVPGAEEVLRVQLVDGNRLWLSSLRDPDYGPPLRGTHAAGAVVRQVALTERAAGTDYQLAPLTGTIRELVEFGDGVRVLASYTAPFLLPATYPAPQNDSPGLDESAGEWRGKALVDGTYRVAVQAWSDLVFDNGIEPTPYRAPAEAAVFELLVGAANELEPYDRIDSMDNCNRCHQTLSFHGGEARGFDVCITCHAAPGTEDLPRYVAAAALDTPGTAVDMRTLVHRIHRGSSLDDPGAYLVVGRGDAPYPANFSLRLWPEVVFPALPGRTANCEQCHGEDTDGWLAPPERDHPFDQLVPSASWATTCGSCHDGELAAAHFESQTTFGGVESCALCHGPGEDEAVELVHFPR